MADKRKASRKAKTKKATRSTKTGKAAKKKTVKKAAAPKTLKAAPTKTRPAPTKKAKRAVVKKAVTKFVHGGVDPTDQERLNKIDHIVVLMLENRSFDQMLGYLKLEGGRDEVDGLTAGLSNRYKEKDYEIHPFTSTIFQNDPCHSAACVALQVSNNNGGFVEDYAARHPTDDPGNIMGYHNGSTVPVYDHLARNFCICDKWFSPVRGATWPNRLYSIMGRADGSKDNKRVPLYNLPSFIRHLDAAKVSWRWYAHDIATLRLLDGNYRVGSFGKFFWFDRKTTFSRTTFLDHAERGDLASVSWIDPNYFDYHVTGPMESNDDHPPSDVMAGQDLVLKLYNAVINSPAWPRTLLLIVYDEHGGFYDHVHPPDEAVDDNANFREYGVRVPAIIVSPWVERGKVSSTIFDHTSIIKTILLKFCQKPDGTIPDMGARVTSANHLGSLLTLETPREPTPVTAYQHLIERIAQWRAQVFTKKTMMRAMKKLPEEPEPTELQEGLIAAKRRLKAEGLPEDQP